jgi:hypothetical protein
MAPIDAGDQSKVSRSTVEGSLIGDSKCCMHNGVPRFVRGVGILTEAYLFDSRLGLQIGGVVEPPEKRELRGTEFERGGYTEQCA